MNSRDYYPVAILLALILIVASSFLIISYADRELEAVRPTRSMPSLNAVPSSPSPMPEVTQAIITSRTRDIPTPTAAPISLTINLQNLHCETLDYYVDGHLAVSGLSGGSNATFSAEPGPHSVEVCQAGTTECGGNVPMEWTNPTTVTIKRGACPVTIKVTNKHCAMVDLYVESEMVLFSLPPGSTATFQTTPGEHLVQACPAGSKDCGEPVHLTWEVSTDLVLSPEPDCP